MTTEELQERVLRLKKEKRAVLLAHYYTRAEVQQVADFVGDSLQLARAAVGLDADIIVFAGVRFMGETAKVLSPDKKVLMPDFEAGCSLADSCPADEFARFVKAHPGHTVVSYVNTSVEVKALTDIVCTSGNALEVVGSIPPEVPVIFGPDRNLGSYIISKTGRDNMVLWNGACHVHEQFSLEAVLSLKKEHPAAKVLVHPECKEQLVMVADHVGSTASLLSYARTSDADEFIVVTEPGIIFKMRQACPGKTFIPAPPSEGDCACNDCSYMKLVTLPKIIDVLTNLSNEITVPEDIAKAALKPIMRMLEL